MTAVAFVDTRPFAWSRPGKDRSHPMIRPAALVVALGAHVLLLYAPRPEPLTPAAVETLEISVVAQGDATTDTAEETQSSAETAPPPEPEPEPPSEPEPPADIAEPPVKEAPDAIVIPVRTLEPPPRLTHQPPKPRPVPRPHAETKPAPKKVVKPSAASVAQHRGHSGVEQGAKVDAGLSVAAYGATLKAEINRHKIYPAAARDRRASGIALVTFSIGPSGRVSAASIARSSGDSALDAAALQAVRSASPPPPPHGQFSGRIAIDFALRRSS